MTEGIGLILRPTQHVATVLLEPALPGLRQ